MMRYEKVEGLAEEQEEYKAKYEELNGKKFIPHVAVADILKMGIVTKLFDLSSSLVTSGTENRIGVAISDCDYETEDSSIIDIAVGIKAKYVNVSGMYQYEHIAKFSRYETICGELSQK
eukprot:TRINITY_DN8806_c0_g1_i10.p2 TRINITY_DN8806_c0_g1~~TRINITY_DN8806_c0_g1_i10.p2  ORF type:complete len:119 (+),score=40.64 TRINITY_DN8806_c0_g1_i10:974-1330(+)